LVSAKAAYEKSRVELDRATGLLLDHSNIDVADATRGQVTHLPQVPYVAPRQESTLAGRLLSRQRHRLSRRRLRLRNSREMLRRQFSSRGSTMYSSFRDLVCRDHYA